MARLDPRRLGLYVVTPGPAAPRRTHEEIATAAISGGADALQLRAPELEDDDLLPLAARLAEMCAAADLLFVVNNRVDVAIRSRAGGAHVGQDEDAGAIRERLGSDKILGVSVADVDGARTAEQADADYLGVTVWSTSTKPEAVPLGIEGLREIVSATALPVVGIGGIDVNSARDVLAAGASGIAVISAVAAADDPVRAVRELRASIDGFSEGDR